MSLRLYVGVLALVTLGHMGVRRAVPGLGASPLLPVSQLTPGHKLEASFFDGLEAEWSPKADPPCLTVVAFDPSCPQTRRAFERRRESGLDVAVPVLWIAKELTPGVQGFSEALPSGDRLIADKGSFRALFVDAIPAGYLIAGDSTLSRVWPFTGRETAQDIEKWCYQEKIR